MLRQQPGYQGGALLNSAGYPLRYTRITVWDNRDALKAFWASTAIQRFAQENPAEGIFTTTRDIEAYEIIHRVSQPGQPTTAVLVDWTTDPGKAQAFADSRKELIELRRRVGRGVVTSAISRFLGGPNRYVVYLSALSAGDLTAFFATPEYQTWVQTHGVTEYSSTPPTIQAFEVVYAQVPASTA